MKTIAQIAGVVLFFFWGCKTEKKPQEVKEELEVVGLEPITEKPKDLKTPEGMVWIPGGEFHMGAVANDSMAMGHEKPRHQVVLDGFFMDEHEVTNAQYQAFVEATGYVTVAERTIDWEEMKKQLPPGTPKPYDSILQPGALIFKKAKSSLPNLFDFSQWWEWKIGANWQHPQGPQSSIEGKENHPVVHIAYEDALAYCEWSGRRLPTEAEWEYAARGGQPEAIFTWGTQFEMLETNANTWEGDFPLTNSLKDGCERRAPVKSYPANLYGLYDMAGNVWEWTSDWYNTDYYGNQKSLGVVKNPKGAERTKNPTNPYAQEKVLKGGSFLCSESYCASYRISARMASSIDSGLEHTGFRTVMGVSSK